jgi:hypothetical protein
MSRWNTRKYLCRSYFDIHNEPNIYLRTVFNEIIVSFCYSDINKSP